MGDIVLVDMDGVLCDTCARVHALSDGLISDNPHSWGWDGYRAIASDIMCSNGFFRDLDPLPGALDGMQELEHIAQVFIVTTPMHPGSMPDKLDWVRFSLGAQWVERVVFTHDKTIVHGDWLYDDKPAIQGVAIPVWRQVAYPWHYNRGIDCDRLTWPEFVEAVRNG